MASKQASGFRLPNFQLGVSAIAFFEPQQFGMVVVKVQDDGIQVKPLADDGHVTELGMRQDAT
jgi:hypothetical protein